MPDEGEAPPHGGGGRRVRIPLRRLRPWLLLVLVAGTTAAGAGMMLEIVAAGGLTALEVGILVLFAATFCWISVPFWTGLIGLTLRLLGRDPLTLRPRPGPGGAGRPTAGPDAATRADGPATARTALVMPVHNEDPDRVVRGLAAVIRSVTRTGHGDRFDLFLLSDTTDPEIAREEESAWAALRRQAETPVGLYYRRRETNAGRKAGNVEEFCRRWGSRYEFMVVLDADSLMSGETLVELVRRMEANPRAGLIQTLPLPARQSTLFGRMLQFGARLHAPALAAGQAFWQGDTANYWGHNAILRVRPFAEHSRLPVLPGDPPLGGRILSHDFVEAALLRRAGWHAYLMPALGGSYEEMPATIPDFGARDRRWAQGSLQHLRLLARRGLHPVSRVHFLMGAMGYLASPMWLLMLLGSTAYVALAETAPHLLAGTGVLPVDGSAISVVPGLVPLLGVTAALLFVPKLLNLAVALGRTPRRFGGRLRLVASGALELVFSVLLAPLMMLYHTRSVASILRGRDVEWSAQRRRGGPVGWREAWRSTLGAVGVGAVWTAATVWISPTFALWMAPIFPGLLLAPALVRWTGSPARGERARGLGLFLVPSEIGPPPVVRDARRPVSPAASTDRTDPLRKPWPLPPERPGPHPAPPGETRGVRQP